MAYSKVIFNGSTLMDVTDKTVTSETLLQGETALKNDGTSITGTYVGGGGGGLSSYTFTFTSVNNFGTSWSTETLSSYGLTVSDFVPTSTHHVLAEFSIPSITFNYTDSNDDDSYSVSLTNVKGSGSASTVLSEGVYVVISTSFFSLKSGYNSVAGTLSFDISDGLIYPDKICIGILQPAYDSISSTGSTLNGHTMFNIDGRGNATLTVYIFDD